jgi:hypothetical protein
MGLVATWRCSAVAIALVLVLTGAVACSDRTSSQSPEPTGAGAGGDDTASGAGGSSGQSAGDEPGHRAGASGAAGTLGGSAGTVAGGGPEHDGGAPLDASDSGEHDAGMPEPVDESCLQGLNDFTERGPFELTATEWDLPEVGRVKVWTPNVPDGCRVPIVHFANGTGATCGSYQSTLEHLASFGFLTLCFESTNTGAGTQCITAAEHAYLELPDLVSDKVGFAGNHSGGQGAFMCLYRAEEAWQDQRLLAGYALGPSHGNGTAGEPSWIEAYGQIDAPGLMISTEGGLVSEMWVGEAFEHVPATTELYQYKAVGASDIPIALEHMNESIVPWFRWKLLGDRDACEYFKAMPDSEAWDLVRAANAADCE